VAGAWVGLALYLASVVLDHADGEVARATGTTTPFGHRLDIGADATVHAALVVALGLATATQGVPWTEGLGLIGGVGVVACAIVADRWPLRGGTAGGRAERWLDGLGNRHGFYIALLAYAVGRTVAPDVLPWVLVVVTLGAHAYWVGRVGLLVAGR